MSTNILIPKTFTSPSYGKVSWEEAISKMVWFIGTDTQASYEVIIGTDSEAQNGSARPQRLADGRSSMSGVADYVSALIVHKKGRGGIYFWSRQKLDNIYSMRQRIWQEALMSLNLAEKLVGDLSSMGLISKNGKSDERINLEIHVDIGPNGETRQMINEIVGMIRANGFNVATKPASWGASHVADRHV